MSVPAPLVHGGALRAAMRDYPNAPTPWIDLSTGINPHPYGLPPLSPAAWARLPEQEEIAALEAAAARAYGAKDPACVVAAPGAQSVIQWLPFLFPARNVAIVGPTYVEHGSRWRAAGAAVRDIPDLDGADRDETIVIVNPNNPDGRFIRADNILATATRLASQGQLIIVDESFADALPRTESIVPHIGSLPILALRSFGKFYGLAGLRLGFAIAPLSFANVLRDAFGPWAVSGPAVAIAQAALADEIWRERTVQHLDSNAARLDLILQAAGLEIVGGTSLFRLATHPRAAVLADHLCAEGIFVRRFAERPTALRFGQPGAEVAWRRLSDACRTWAG